MAHVTSSRQSTTVHAISLALILIVFFTSPAHSASSIQLTWDPSPASDLGGYNVYMGTTPGSYNTTNNAGLNQSYIFQNLPEGITYYFSATAYDQSGNISEPAEEVSIALPTQGGDITAPSVPSNLQATSLSTTEISLNWTPSTDNVGVTGYTVSRNSTVVASVSTASYIDQGLIPSTTYTYNVTAHDAAGNVSAASAPTSAPTKTPNDSTLPLTISNLTVASGQAYVVPASGLQVGSTVYIDRSFTFATVPTNVQGALYIQTANNDKAATNTAFLSFTVNQPVTVYVAHDVRITPKPTWLTNFTDTGKELVTSDATLHLFARSFSPGTITLGGNAGGGNSMYSIIIQPHSLNQNSPTKQDLNGDGKADLVWRNTQTGQVAVWLLNGTSITASGFLGGVPKEWVIKGVGDVDGNGTADLIWRNATSGLVAVWHMNGTTITNVGFLGGTGLTWTIEKVGDLNGDGKADLVWQNTQTGQVAVWLLNGSSIAASGFLSGVPVVWKLKNVGDVDGNGTADLIWRNTTSGAVAIWHMNGLTINSVNFPGSASTDWEIQ